MSEGSAFPEEAFPRKAARHPVSDGSRNDVTAPLTGRPLRIPTAWGVVTALSREDARRVPECRAALAATRKDGRYIEIVADTLQPQFEHGYLVVEDGAGRIRAVQPFFVVDQDVAEGAGRTVRLLAALLRRLLPGALRTRTLMVGCAAGEGVLDQADGAVVSALHEALPAAARAVGARLVVLKEFPANYRDALRPFAEDGYARIPSFPMTQLFIGYESFDEYMRRALSRSMRKNLRRKFRASAGARLEMERIEDVDRVLDEIYPLYLAVYERSRHRFEQLTPEFLRRLVNELPERTRLFVWRLGGTIVAFSLCLVHGDAIYDEYLGLDYDVALDLHLYFVTFRDVVGWAMSHGYRWYVSNPLAYDPKLHLGCELLPLDLYVMHTSKLVNGILRRALPLLEPTRTDPTLRRFRDYASLRS